MTFLTITPSSAIILDFDMLSMFYDDDDDHGDDDYDGHLEHVLHVVLHLPESRPSAGLPLPALPHQAEHRI